MNQPGADFPLVGVAALIIKDGRLLLGKRRKSPGENSWQCPGGSLELGETVFDCAIRETREKTGLVIDRLVHGPYTSNFFAEENFHSITLYVVASCDRVQLENREPSAASDWGWYKKDELPEPLFLPLLLLKQDHPVFWEQLF
ncbi:MAG: NUDIX domain-containing protein [Gammaproteobacteria bacterium]|nr:NUDIX domain-containing protein [Gammaproteobacteria bacterium]